MVAQVETEAGFRSRTPQPLFQANSYLWSSAAGSGRVFDLSPDGNRFLLLKPEAGEETTEAALEGLIFVANWFEELKSRVPVP